MTHIEPLTTDRLRRRCNVDDLPFDHTGELTPIEGFLGQDRAITALRFGVEIEHDSYHLFALGPSGLGKHDMVQRLLAERASQRETPSDWCYVHNFDEPHRPKAIALPVARGLDLQHALDQLIEELQSALPAAFESDDYRTRRQAIEDAAQRRQEEAFETLQTEARAKDVALVRTPVGMALAPLRGEEVLKPEAFKQLSEDDQTRIKTDIEDLQIKLEALMRQMPQWEREARNEVRELNREVTTFAVQHLIEEIRSAFKDLPAVQTHLEAIERHLIDTTDHGGEGKPNMVMGSAGPIQIEAADRYRHYRVNLLIERSRDQRAPIVYEDHPSHQNLLGRIEHLSQFGALSTDFSLIKPGALHRANGGYLILDARRVLMQPFAWEELKRALRAQQIRIESLAQSLSLISTVTLEPEPIPLDVKVVLIGDRILYYLLCALDPDFGELFKVPVDFSEDVDWSDDNALLLARMLGAAAKKNELRPLDRGAVARVIEHAARLADDTVKLSVHEQALCDLLREADVFAKRHDRATIGRDDVEAALEAQIYRADRIREQSLEHIRRGTIMIDTKGTVVGQINGLVVSTIGGFTFGRPMRITASTRLGRGQVVDIEREVEFGGPIHAKGVLILQGFLGARFAADQPLTLHASLVFEQSYGPVEGDSASAAELYALLSALSSLPIKQSFAVTGSVNQMGQIQPIGGVNEKIEGFFDACGQSGLTGDQGVIIPHTNVDNLMLRQDVIDSVEQGQFRVYAVETIDQGMELLTGEIAGTRDADGRFPEGTINRRIADRLTELAAAAKRFGSRDREGSRDD
ncbi:MAG: Lon protease family protein [Geminicoccaceae bacterium]